MAALDFLPGALNAAREDVNSLISRQWARSDAQRAREDAERSFERNAALQREFAQHGIRWRVEDAQAAGLHPLFALGGGGAAFSPTVAIGTGPASSMPAGQNLMRASQAQETDEQREMTYLNLLAARENVKRSHLENMFLENKLSELRRGAGQSAPMPSATGEQFGGISYKPSEIPSSDWAQPEFRAGVRPGMTRERIGVGPGGRDVTIPSVSSDISETFENPITGLWMLNKAIIEDPEFLKYSDFPFGKDYYRLMESLWDMSDRLRQWQIRNAPDPEYAREYRGLLAKQRMYAKKRPFRPYYPQR